MQCYKSLYNFKWFWRINFTFSGNIHWIKISFLVVYPEKIDSVYTGEPRRSAPPPPSRPCGWRNIKPKGLKPLTLLLNTSGFASDISHHMFISLPVSATDARESNWTFPWWFSCTTKNLWLFNLLKITISDHYPNIYMMYIITTAILNLNLICDEDGLKPKPAVIRHTNSNKCDCFEDPVYTVWITHKTSITIIQ